jgi:OmpA-OmpF porin, OOP family
MKRASVLLVVCVLLSSTSFSQTNSGNIKQPTLGLSFVMNDFKTAANIRATSLSTVVRDKSNAKIKDMTPGLAVSYLEGISKHVDFSATLAGSFVDYPFENRSGAQTSGSESLLLEIDASVNAKMFEDKYWVNPYLSVGVGASKYKGYYGAVIPVGVGLQVDFFREAFIFINSQYRLRVTDNTSHHFYHSIGFAGVIGR